MNGGDSLSQHEATAPLDSSSQTSLARSHIENLGKLIEDMEIKLRNLLQEVYFSSKFPFAFYSILFSLVLGKSVD